MEKQMKGLDDMETGSIRLNEIEKAVHRRKRNKGEEEEASDIEMDTKRHRAEAEHGKSESVNIEAWALNSPSLNYSYQSHNLRPVDPNPYFSNPNPTSLETLNTHTSAFYPDPAFPKQETYLAPEPEPCEENKYEPLESVFQSDLPSISYDDLLNNSIDFLDDLNRSSIVPSPSSSLEASWNEGCVPNLTFGQSGTPLLQLQQETDSKMFQECFKSLDLATNSDLELQRSEEAAASIRVNEQPSISGHKIEANSIQDLPPDLVSIKNEDCLKEASLSLFKCRLCTFETNLDFMLNIHINQIHKISSALKQTWTDEDRESNVESGNENQAWPYITSGHEVARAAVNGHASLLPTFSNDVEPAAEESPYSHSNPFLTEPSMTDQNTELGIPKTFVESDKSGLKASNTLGNFERKTAPGRPDYNAKVVAVTQKLDSEQTPLLDEFQMTKSDLHTVNPRRGMVIPKTGFSPAALKMAGIDLAVRKPNLTVVCLQRSSSNNKVFAKKSQLPKGSIIIKTSDPSLYKTANVVAGDMPPARGLYNHIGYPPPSAQNASIKATHERAACARDETEQERSQAQHTTSVANLSNSNDSNTANMFESSESSENVPVQGLPYEDHIYHLRADPGPDPKTRRKSSESASETDFSKDHFHQGKKIQRRPRNWRALLMQKLEELNPPLSGENDEANPKENNSMQKFWQEFTNAKDIFKTRLPDGKEVEGPGAFDVLHFLKFENQVKVEKEKNKKLTYELQQLRKLKNVKVQLSELREEHEETKKTLAETRDALNKMTQQYNQRNDSMSAVEASDGRIGWEKQRLAREFESKDEHLASIRTTLEMILKKDADFCGNSAADNGGGDAIKDEDLVEIVNSILCQFGQSKQRHFNDVQNCLVEMTDLHQKKTFYKKLGLKMKEKVKILEEQNQDLKTKFNMELANKEKLNATKLDLETAIDVKDKQILKLNEQTRMKHEEFQKQIDLLKAGIGKKLEAVKIERDRLVEMEAELQARVKVLEDKNKYLKVVEVNLRNEVSLLESKVTNNEFKARIKVLEEQVESKEKEIVELKQHLEEETERLINEFKKEKTELVKAKSALEKEAKAKTKQDLGMEDANVKSEPVEVQSLRSELQEKSLILEVVQRSNFILEAKSKNLTAELRKNEESHRKVMTQYKSSLDTLKGEVFLKIKAKNEKIGEMIKELEEKEKAIAMIKNQQNNKKNAKIALLEQRRKAQKSESKRTAKNAQAAVS